MDYKSAIEAAAEAISEAPEDLREAAFRVVLERLLERDGTASVPAVEYRPNEGTQQSPSGKTDWEARLIAGLPEAHIVHESGDRTKQAVWAVVTLHGRGAEVTSDAIRDIIRTELGTAPQNGANTARTLRDLTPKYLMRRDRTDGRGYVYQPTANALDAFQQ